MTEVYSTDCLPNCPADTFFFGAQGYAVSELVHAVVPEPSTFLLLAVPLLGATMLRLKRRSRIRVAERLSSDLQELLDGTKVVNNTCPLDRWRERAAVTSGGAHQRLFLQIPGGNATPATRGHLKSGHHG